MTNFEINTGDAHSFAFIKTDGVLTYYEGTSQEVDSIDELTILAEQNPKILFALPYNTLEERGYEAKGDKKIQVLVPTKSVVLEGDVETNFLTGGFQNISMSDVHPSVSDEDFALSVQNVVEQEIALGNISQVNLSRSFEGKIDDFDREKAITIYKKLANKEGAYMSYLFYFGGQDQSNQNDSYLIGASPETHIRVDDEVVMMNPIAGTMIKSGDTPLQNQIVEFINSKKDTEELVQVTDEELKVMSQTCEGLPWVEGPFLRDAGQIVHTEYRVKGERPEDAFAALRGTLFMPTIIGSPLESAARVIGRHEENPRNFYTGVVGVSEKNPVTEQVNLNTAIIIRTLEIDSDGNFKIQAGGGITRDSDPVAETNENKGKAYSILRLLKQVKTNFASSAEQIENIEQFRPLLDARNERLASVWFRGDQYKPNFDNDNVAAQERVPNGKSITLINNEDEFIFLIGKLLYQAGYDTNVVSTFDYDENEHAADLVLLGPGPGDINDTGNPRMVVLNQIFNQLIRDQNQQIFGVCLGHQTACKNMGFDVVKQPAPTQGLPFQVPVKRVEQRMGFYNSFSPVFNAGAVPGLPVNLEHIDLVDGDRIMAFFSDRLNSVQFHPESLLSEYGAQFLVATINQQLGVSQEPNEEDLETIENFVGFEAPANAAAVS